MKEKEYMGKAGIEGKETCRHWPGTKSGKESKGGIETKPVETKT